MSCLLCFVCITLGSLQLVYLPSELKQLFLLLINLPLQFVKFLKGKLNRVFNAAD